MKKMKRLPKICFIDVVRREAGSLDPPLNLVSLANYLLSKKMVSKSDLRVINSAFEDVLSEVKSMQPDIVGFSVMTPFYNDALRLARELKKITNAKFIIGGYHISALPEFLEKPFDIGVIGEGEYPLVNLVKLWQKGKISSEEYLKKIPGIVFFDKLGKVVRNENEKIFNVDDLPVVDWSIVPPQRVVKYLTIPVDGVGKSMRMTSMYTARGCPYNCAFCAHRVITNGDRRVRYFSLKRVLDEMVYLHKVYKVDCIQILDDTFAVSKRRLRDLIVEMKRRGLYKKIYFYNLFVRANIIDEEFAGLLKELGTTTVFIGIESASQNVLKIIKDGPLSEEIVKTAIEHFEKEKIFVTGSFMLFSPGETKDDFLATLRLVRWFEKKRYAFAVIFSVTTPYPGTKLWVEAIKLGILDINKLNWEDFVMFYLGNFKKMPKAFYEPNWAGKVEMYRYWRKYIRISAAVRSNLNKIDRWEEAQVESAERNKLVEKAFLGMKRAKKRYRRFMNDPKSAIGQLIKRPMLIRWMIDDIKVMLSG
jgi:radical SAM superfamily enzyme YgiQ (UPF0313 family)